MRTTGRRKTTSHAWKKQGPGKNSACPLISSRSPHTRSDQSEPTFAGIRPTGVPRFRAAQIVGARFAFFVALAHGRIRGQMERFLLLFEKTRFVHNDWRFSEWGKLRVCPHVSSVPTFPRLKPLSPRLPLVLHCSHEPIFLRPAPLHWKQRGSRQIQGGTHEETTVPRRRRPVRSGGRPAW